MRERYNNITMLVCPVILSETDQHPNLQYALIVLACLTIAAIMLLTYRNQTASEKHIKQLRELNEDINEQKRTLEGLLEEVQKADKEKDRILKAVSHDMRSPVHSAMALVDLILNDKENLTEEQIGYLNLIKDSCSNAVSLTKDLLEIVTMHTETMAKEKEDICNLIKSSVELLQFKAGEKNQTIKVKIPDTPCELFINKEKIQRVVNNLVNNAIKFSNEGAEIHVKLDIDHTGAKLSVADNGIGIPDDIKHKIFDLFTEAKRYGTSGEQPYGLGLSISRQILDAHSGKIWFESTAGKGTTFYAHIPA